MDEKRWTRYLDRIARTAHNSLMADDWDGIPDKSIEKDAWRQVALNVVREMQQIIKEAVTLCPDCKQEIDPDVCCCGDPIEGHSDTSGHTPTPMGCICGYEEPITFPQSPDSENSKNG